LHQATRYGAMRTMAAVGIVRRVALPAPWFISSGSVGLDRNIGISGSLYNTVLPMFLQARSISGCYDAWPEFDQVPSYPSPASFRQ
jgi:hypothetical protein